MANEDEANGKTKLKKDSRQIIRFTKDDIDATIFELQPGKETRMVLVNKEYDSSD